ncbi:MAG TPA: cupredoxin family copper-binding protein [Gemmatimonadota bacterium]|nr:cupredoxin family copper-binding protein [Gemmatimonadota bacterium]
MRSTCSWMSRVALASIVLAAPVGVKAQPVTGRTPNLAGTWTASPGHLFFDFSHRFQVVGPNADITDIFGDGKIVNYPTFQLDFGLAPGLMAGFRYSTRSLLAGGSNEWQPYATWSPGGRHAGPGPSVALTAAWNGGTSSADGEITGQTRFGPLRVLGAVRGFSDGFDHTGADRRASLALAGGLGLELNRFVTLAGDAADLVAGMDGPAAWSAGLEVAIPYTPHTLSIMATNVSSGTLEGTSVGVPGTVYWGFEFTVPFSGFARWGQLVHPEGGGSDEGSGGGGAAATGAAPTASGHAVGGPGTVVEIEIKSLAFHPDTLRIRPGTTVRWVNHDPLAHSTTSSADIWASPLIDPGSSYQRKFEEPGRYAYHCTPHPFMKGIILVTRTGG